MTITLPPPKYVIAAFSYSAIRKLCYTWNTEYCKTTYDKDTNTLTTKYSPILITDRIVHSTLAGLVGIYLTPWNVAKDIRRMEVAMRGKSWEDYTETTPQWSTPRDLDFVGVMLDFSP